MMMIIGPRHSRGAHDFRAPREWRVAMKVFFQGGKSLDSWTPGPKPLCHRRPTGPHPSGLLRTPAQGDSSHCRQPWVSPWIVRFSQRGTEGQFPQGTKPARVTAVQGGPRQGAEIPTGYHHESGGQRGDPLNLIRVMPAKGTDISFARHTGSPFVV